MQKIIAFFLSIIMFLVPWANIPKAEIDKSAWNTDYTCVFVHGFSGWGDYEFRHHFLSYWGILGGDLNKYLNARGLDTHAASVDPYGSTWDRTCELYAQLTGTRTDYGKAHSEKYGHDRYGKDFTGKALIDSWSAEDKVNLFGHSFGGTTIRYIAELMANGNAEEIAATPADEISPLFTGGKGDWIYSITTLSTPHNGTTTIAFDGDMDPEPDTGVYDMYIDNAIAFNDEISTLPDVYYFSYSTSAAIRTDEGTYVADTSVAEITSRGGIDRMGSYTGVTKGGVVIDESWLDSDGTVNVISSRAPFGAPQTEFDESNIQPGVWNVMPTWRGDHTSLNGGILIHGEIRPLYIEMINRINSL